MSSLIDVRKVTVRICLADPTGYIAVVCQCIFQTVAYHHILGRNGILLCLGQKIICHLKSMCSIIIICIDHHKRAVNNFSTA